MPRVDTATTLVQPSCFTHLGGRGGGGREGGKEGGREGEREEEERVGGVKTQNEVIIIPL